METRKIAQASEIEISAELVCPLTMQIYLEPVMLPNGTVVEKEAIQCWVFKNHTNPYTRQALGITEFELDLSTMLKVNEFLSQYPEKMTEQFIKGSVKSKTVRRLFFEDVPLELPNEDNQQERELVEQMGRLKV